MFHYSPNLYWVYLHKIKSPGVSWVWDPRQKYFRTIIAAYCQKIYDDICWIMATPNQSGIPHVWNLERMMNVGCGWALDSLFSALRNHSSMEVTKTCQKPPEIYLTPYSTSKEWHPGYPINRVIISNYNPPACFEVQGKNLFRGRVIKLCITWVNRPTGI